MSVINSGAFAMRLVATSPEVDALLRAGAPVAIGVSGGKDSHAVALATVEYLDAIGHTGPRVLVHSDLGAVEWDGSLPKCEELAARLDLELLVVRRPAGGLMERWEARWESSKRRYELLSTVTVVLPWSTPSMRFCTSELKTHVITAALKRRFPKQVVVNVTGIRRAESASRAGAEVASREANSGYWSWRPIIDWSTAEVFEEIARHGMDAHPAYAEFGMSRVSCRFCIMSSISDLTQAAAQSEAHPLYRRMVQLEIDSAFAFQGARWLGDVAPQVLSEAEVRGVAEAKRTALARVAAESRISKAMLYVKGWPTRMLTNAEADVLAATRRAVCTLYGWTARYLDRAGVHHRYQELLAERAAGAVR